MGLQIERVPTLQDNYTYVIACDETGEAAIIDAPEFDPVVARVDSMGVRVTHVLSTHHHWDHSGANPELAKHFDAPVFGHVSDSDRIPAFSNGLEEGDTLQVGRQEARILFIPAHTRAHIAYVFDDAQATFCGDTLFAAGCGRLFEGTPEMMFVALHEKLGALPDTTRVFCGHEYTESNLVFAAHVEPDNLVIQEKLTNVREIRAKAAAEWRDATPEEMTVPSTLGEERQTNPFLRATDAADLGRIRALKDSF
ncbi:hydroxyacylglutathione hydrolase [Myxococcota bacterium]|nr:hydroxyacylglutathione hydrolase [Myxococcota bacterium]